MIASTPTWQEAIAERLVGAGVEVAAWVPDKRLAPIATALEGRIPIRSLSSEEACVGYASGFRAAGGMPAVMCQCSGLGNALNALGSMAIPYGLGFPLVISMRGTLGAEPRAGRARPLHRRPSGLTRNPELLAWRPG